MGKSERVSKAPPVPADLAIDDSDLGVPVASAGGYHQPYVDLDTIRSSDDLVVIISQRRSNGMLTFGVFKEFVRDHRTDRTTFVSADLMPAYRAILKIAEERLEQIKNDPKLMRELQIKAIGEAIPVRARSARP